MRSHAVLRSAVGVLATVVLVVGGALWLLRPEGGAGSAATDPTPVAAAAVVDAPAVAAAQVGTDGQVESYEVFGGKNPFQRPPADPGTPTTTTTTPGGGGGVTTTTSFPPGPGGGTTTTTVVPGDEPIRGTTIALVDVFAEGSEKKAVVRVNGRLYVAAEGDTFAGNITLVRVDLGTRCADFTMGSRSFTLCVGQEIIK